MESVERAQELASYIRIGSLSLELTELRSSVVAAQLGEEAISTSLIAGLIGLIIVILFMIIAYRVPGAVAGLSLIFYTATILLTLNAFLLPFRYIILSPYNMKMYSIILFYPLLLHIFPLYVNQTAPIPLNQNCLD